MKTKVNLGPREVPSQSEERLRHTYSTRKSVYESLVITDHQAWALPLTLMRNNERTNPSG